MDSRFAGLEAIDWAGMTHAYGTAEAVPAILLGLLDPDPVVREQALDDFYGAVHHQSDVYECTVACVPFLIEAATDMSVPDRHELLRLIASICWAEGGSVQQWDEGAPDPYGDRSHVRAARDIVAAHWDRLAPLIEDPAPAVRKESAAVLAACIDKRPLAFGLLRQRAGEEPDSGVRQALIATIGALGREPSLRDEGAQWLGHLSTSDSVPGIRLQALASLISLDPGTVGDDLPETVAQLVAACFRSDPRPLAPPPGEMGNPATLVAAVRHIEAQRHAEFRLPEVTRLVGQITAALGDDIGLRAEIVTRLLDIPEWGVQRACCGWAQELIQNWRHDDYTPLVEAVTRLLAHAELRVRKVATETLLNLGPLALPAADALVHVMSGGDIADPDVFFDVSAADSALRTLAGLGDPRALPVILDMLGRDDPPHLWELGQQARCPASVARHRPARGRGLAGRRRPARARGSEDRRRRRGNVVVPHRRTATGAGRGTVPFGQRRRIQAARCGQARRRPRPSRGGAAAGADADDRR